MSVRTLSDEEIKAVQKTATKILKEFDRICKKHNLKYSLAHGSLIGQVRHGGFIPWDDDVDVMMPRNDYIKLRKICKTELKKPFFYQTHETDKEWFFLYDKIRYTGTVYKETAFEDKKINHGVFLDIFPLDKIPDNHLLRFIQYKRHSFYRLILHCKYVNIKSRHGLKKALAIIIRVLFPFYSLENLYNKCIRISTKYNDNKTFKSHRKFDDIKKISRLNYPKMFDTERVKFENITVCRTKNYDQVLSEEYGNYMQLPPIEQRHTIHDITELII